MKPKKVGKYWITECKYCGDKVEKTYINKVSGNVCEPCRQERNRTHHSPSYKILSRQEWNRILDSYIITNKMTVEDYEALGRKRVFSETDVIQLIKKCYKRIKHNEEKKTIGNIQEPNV